MTLYKNTLLALSLMALSLSPVNEAMACFGWCCGSNSDEDKRREKQPIVRTDSDSSLLITVAPAVVPQSDALRKPPASGIGRDDSRDSSAADATLSSRMMSGADMTAVDMSRTSAAAIALPRSNDDLIPHLVRALREGAYPGITFEHTSRKLVMNFDCKDVGTMQIALVYVGDDNTTTVDQGCSGGTKVKKQEFPLVSSLIVSTVREAIHTHHKMFTRTLNAVLQALYERTAHAAYRLSADERLREFVLDVKGQTGTSFDKLYGVSAPLGHPSLGKRVHAYN